MGSPAPSATPHCTRCGASLDPSAQFCAFCGASRNGVWSPTIPGGTPYGPAPGYYPVPPATRSESGTIWTIVIVVIVVLVVVPSVLAGLLFLGVTRSFPGAPPLPTPIGTAFNAGSPVLGQCAIGNTFAADGCQAGDYTYTLTVEVSTVPLGDVLFSIMTVRGSVVTVAGSGGFAVVNQSGALLATSTESPSLYMSGGWYAFYGYTGAGTTIMNLDSILVDMGRGNPAGNGYVFVAQGTGSYSGTTQVSLP